MTRARTCVAVAAIAASAAPFAALAGDPLPLKEAKINIEYNATDKDTGFQGFVDSEGWGSLVVTGPDGDVLRFEGLGTLGAHGLTELFFETVEPAVADMPIADVLAMLPAGSYKFSGTAIEAGESLGPTEGVAWLTHDIPEGPVLLSPGPDATVGADDLTVSWEPVTTTLTGSRAEIVAYQLIVEKAGDPPPHMIGKFGLSMYLGPSVTAIDLPKGFLEPDTGYAWEVLAIEKSGNQTLSSGAFRTR